MSKFSRGLTIAASLALVSIAYATESSAQPVGYYNGVDTTNATTLRSTLHPVIDDHTRYPYTSTGIDTWNILEDADEDPNDPGRILDLYKNASYAKFGAGNSYYTREHSWPSSYGFSSSGAVPYTDCHMLFLADGAYNSTRGNKPYRTCTGCTELATQVNDGQGGTGQSNFSSGSSSNGIWETWIGRRGDAARAVLYMDIRYEGGTHGVTGASEPDLRVTDDPSQITVGGNYMGMMTDLLRWNIDDPPSDRERNRLEVVYSYQHNRNPFIDHPEWAGCLFKGACPTTSLAAAPASLVGTTDDASISLDWNDSPESMVLGYRVYRSTSASGTFTRLNARLLVTSNYLDTAVSSGTRYYYRVYAVDAAGRESSYSSTDVWPGAPEGPDVVFISEIHYDNDGADTNEAIEISAPAGTNLSGWKLIAYNGAGGGQYATVNLSGTIVDQSGCYGTASFALVGLQNGAPDGIALVDPTNTVIELLSYEGTMVATDGPASGMTATDIGVSETATTPVGYSLQRRGTGLRGSDFSFFSASASSFGQVNTGLTFTSCQ